MHVVNEGYPQLLLYFEVDTKHDETVTELDALHYSAQ